MRTTRRWFFVTIFLILGLLWGQTPATAQDGGGASPEPVYYPETGHWVTAEFLQAYTSVPDPVTVYGYPITEAFQDQTTGYYVQYFQRARFELHPENPPELRVVASPLGVYLHTRVQTFYRPENVAGCKNFPETGFSVCYAFLDFFKAHGGAAQFGYPISDFETHEGWIMQYFQRARLEWHPERPAQERVVLSDLGRIYFDTVRENPVRLLPAPVQGNRPQDVLSLQVRAFPQQAVLGLSGVQTVYIIVQDQNLQPLSDAQITLTLALPGGQQERVIVPDPTDKHGITRFEYIYQAQAPGSVTIQVNASYGNLKTATATSFRIWW